MALVRESSGSGVGYCAERDFDDNGARAINACVHLRPAVLRAAPDRWHDEESVPMPETLPGEPFGAEDSGILLPRPPASPSVLADQLLQNVPRVEENGKMVLELGGIQILSKLGQGGMGAVYYGIHPRLNQQVAIKILPIQLAQRLPESVKRFIREAQLAASVRNPHLVGVLDVNQENGLFYLVMEFVDGPTAEMHLRDTLLRGETGLAERTALDICIAAARGLDAAHGSGVIHRDIKPDNIIIPRHKAINPSTHSPNRLSFQNSKLTDLGLARHEMCASNMTRVNVCMGTPGFMAPEQAQDARRAGKPADVFSLAATLYCLLAGDAPFTGSDMNEVLHATFTTPHIPIRHRRPDVSAPTAALLDLCLAKKPKDRPSSATALLRELCACRRHVLIERGRAGK